MDIILIVVGGITLVTLLSVAFGMQSISNSLKEIAQLLKDKE